MPRATIPVQVVQNNKNAAVTYTNADATNDMMFQNNGRTLLLVKNGSGVAVQLTVVSVPSPKFGRTQNIVKSIAAGADEIVGFLTPSGWNQKSGADVGKVYIDFDLDTSVEVAALGIKG